MKKALRIIGIILVVLIVIGGAGIAYITYCLPDVGKAPELKVQANNERIEHGKYLANSVMVCVDCHSARDWTQFSGPVVPGTEGRGGEKFGKELGFPGTFYARNITPHNLSKWTDGEIYRAVTTGVNKQGEPLFPIMPYHYYGQLDPGDMQDVIAYIRTLPAINYSVPERSPDFPFSIILHTIPSKAAPEKKPMQGDSIAYGRYLVKAAACIECHTKVDDKAQLIAGTEFGGGREFIFPNYTLRSANISPDQTGIGTWTKEQFIQRFKQYVQPGYVSPKLAMNDPNTIMPWTMYGKMTESDLSSIYQYLKTLPPQHNEVVKWDRKIASK